MNREPEPYVNHIHVSLDGAHHGGSMTEMRWAPEGVAV